MKIDTYVHVTVCGQDLIEENTASCKPTNENSKNVYGMYHFPCKLDET